ncbi:MAG: hypothetical protein ACOCYV_00220 [Planctomycetota bacterium]
MACLLLLPLGQLTANTRFGFGTIVKVDPTGEDSRKGQPSFSVRFAFRNLKWTRITPVLTYRIEEKTRHGWRVYLLDGQPSTAAEALQVGRAICMSDNDMVCRVASSPGPYPVAATATPGDCVYRLNIDKALCAELAKAGRDGFGEYEQRRFDIEVLLDCQDGKITAATAVIPSLRGQSDYRLDPSTWTWDQGTITGSLAFTVGFTDDSRYRPRAGTEIAIASTLELSTQGDGGLAGTHSGTSGAESVSGSVEGRREPRSEIPESGRLWLQLDEFDGSKCSWAVLPFAADTGGADGDLLHFKGGILGSCDGSGLTLADGRLHGTATCIDQRHGDATYRLTIDADLFGGRFLLGRCVVTTADNQERDIALRGGLTTATANRIRGREGDAERQEIEDLQRKLHPDSD